MLTESHAIDTPQNLLLCNTSLQTRTRTYDLQLLVVLIARYFSVLLARFRHELSEILLFSLGDGFRLL